MFLQNKRIQDEENDTVTFRFRHKGEICEETIQQKYLVSSPFFQIALDPNARTREYLEGKLFDFTEWSEGYLTPILLSCLKNPEVLPEIFTNNTDCLKDFHSLLFVLNFDDLIANMNRFLSQS